MTQNIYDDATFFAGYSGLPRSIKGLDGAPEWPALRALLPEMSGLRVLDLGCGFGWFCRWARAQGASSVIGIDVSENMLTRARAETQDAAITYRAADLEQVQLDSGAFDLVYSSLALHYIAGLDALLPEVHRALAPGGRLVFSVEHPIFTAPARQGWLNADDRKIWPVEGYLEEGARTTRWLGAEVIKQHRTLASHVQLLLKLDFAITDLVEWGPAPEQIARAPELAIERERPAFLLMSCRRA
jgi:SAM-dependent methyltransferase